MPRVMCVSVFACLVFGLVVGCASGRDQLASKEAESSMKAPPTTRWAVGDRWDFEIGGGFHFERFDRRFPISDR